jgi:hypothetical protein
MSRYERVVREDNPFAYYKMNDSAVGTLLDATGRGHDAVSHVGSPVRLQPSVLRTAHRSFGTVNPPVDVLSANDPSTYFGVSGSNPQGYYLNNSDGAFGSPKWSMEWWMGDVRGSGTRCFFQHAGRIRVIIAGGQLRIYHWSHATSSWIKTTPFTGDDFPDEHGYPSMLTVTFDGSTYRYYNCGLDYGYFLFSNGSIGGAPEPFPSSQPLLSGSGNNPFFGNNDGNDIMGKVDELSFYNYALSPERVAVHWAGDPAPVVTPGPGRVRFSDHWRAKTVGSVVLP